MEARAEARCFFRPVILFPVAETNCFGLFPRIAATTLLLTGLVCGVAWSVPSSAQAQEASASERALARRAFQQGMDAARAERWEDARVAFARAYQLVHRPRVLLNLATAQVETGHLVEGAENYRNYVRDAGEDGDPRLIREATHRLAEVEARTPRLTLLVTGLGPDDELLLDDTSVSRAVLSAQLPVNPGTHQLRVMRAGAQVARTQVTLVEGAEQSLRLEVPASRRIVGGTSVPGPEQAARDGSETPEHGVLEPTPDHPDSPSSGGAWRSPWLWIAVGLVVAGGVTAGVLLTRDSGQSAYSGNVPPGFLEVR